MDIEQLIRELNDPRNQSSPEVINEIQKQIQRRQREPSAWQLGLDLLSHDEPVMRFYGALTLTIKVNADWDIDKVGEDRHLINHLLENLVSNYVRLSSIPDATFVLQKLSTTLVAVFQKPQSAWALPVRHLAACTIANRYLPQNEVPDLTALLASEGAISGHQLKSILTFSTTLAEQGNAISGSPKEQGVRVRMSNNLHDIWQLLHLCSIYLDRSAGEPVSDNAHTYKISVNSDGSQTLDLVKAMLQLVPFWAHGIKVKSPKHDATSSTTTFDFFQATVKTLARLFPEEALSSSVLQTFTALEESVHGLLQRAIPRYEEHIVKSSQAIAWVEQSVSGDFDVDSVLYMNYLEACMSQADVTTPLYLENSSYVEVLSQIQKLVRCDGVAGIDDTVCQVALELLTSVTEGFSDWPEGSPHRDTMEQLVKSSCSSVMYKIRIPKEELSTETQTWDVDDRAKFQDFRYDVQDFLQNAFGILGEALIDEIVATTVSVNAATEWDVFEAGLFSLTAFSDTLANEPEKFDKYLTAVFGCERWHATVQAEVEVPGRVRKVMIKLLGESTGFLQRHTEFLVPGLNFLFTSLHMASSATAASRAIYTLCDAQRSMLTEALSHFMNSLNATASIEADARHRIYAAVGAIVQALPTEDAKVEPLTQVLRRLATEAASSLTSQSDHNDKVASAVDILQTIGALGRGLRAPSDAPVDLEKSETTGDDFWTQESGAAVQQQALQIYTELFQSTNGQTDPLFVEAACEFIRSGFTEDHPSPFKFPNAKTLELLWPYMRPSCPQPDHVMSTASGYLASVRPEDPTNEFSALLLMSTRSITDTVTASKTQNGSLDSDFCAATLDFYTRLLPKWATTLFAHPSAHDTITLTIELALALVEDSDTLPRRAGAAFLTAIFETSAQPTLNPQSNPDSPLSGLLTTFTPRIVATLVHLVAGVCSRSDIDSLAEPLRRAIQRQPLLVNRLLREAVKDQSGVLNEKALRATKPELRDRFVAQLEMLVLRGGGGGGSGGGRKVVEVVREFWIACRGAAFEYVT